LWHNDFEENPLKTVGVSVSPANFFFSFSSFLSLFHFSKKLENDTDTPTKLSKNPCPALCHNAFRVVGVGAETPTRHRLIRPDTDQIEHSGTG